MFKHIVEIKGRFYIRRWSVVCWEYWENGGGWWMSKYRSCATAFASASEARDAYKLFRERKKERKKRNPIRFIGFL